MYIVCCIFKEYVVCIYRYVCVYIITYIRFVYEVYIIQPFYFLRILVILSGC